MATKNEYDIKGNRTLRMPLEIEKWLIRKAKPKMNSVQAEIKDILIQKYQQERKAA